MAGANGTAHNGTTADDSEPDLIASMEANSPLERATMRKVTRRLIPFMFLLYIFAVLDRSNVTVAVLTMKNDLGLNDEMYGFGAGIFFVGYFLFEVPSNVMMERFGARRWIARIMFTWGLIASAMMLMRTPTHFYALRVLLGLAEAGFFPGMILYLTYWFPSQYKGQAAARFIIAGAVAGIIAGPLGAFLLNFNGFGGLHGWQWLFLMEGIPSFLLGFAVLFYLTDTPAQARWLRDDERAWLMATLAREKAHRQKYHHMTLWQAFAYPRVLQLTALFFLYIFSGAGLGVFTNLILKQRTGWSDQRILVIGVIPTLVGAIVLIAAAAHSDRTRERRLHTLWGMVIAAVGIALVALTRSPVMTITALCVMAVGTSIFNAPFWALTTSFLSGAAAAGGIAFINSIGNLGGFVGPVVMGWLKTHTTSYDFGLYATAGTFLLGAYVAFRLPPDPAQTFDPTIQTDMASPPADAAPHSEASLPGLALPGLTPMAAPIEASLLEVSATERAFSETPPVQAAPQTSQSAPRLISPNDPADGS